ncbi:MAG: isochorismate synthase [Simkaniaceae bacterium]|nr:isochorismate synthase [Simkaniaceae bacterium]
MREARTIQDDLIHQFSEALLHTSPKNYIIAGVPLSIARISLKIEIPDLMTWLHHQTLLPKVYFKDRGKEEERATVGELFVTHQIPTFETFHSDSPQFFGGIDFFTKKRKSSIWDALPECYFFIPIVEITKRSSDATITLNLTPNYNIQELIKKLEFFEKPFDIELEKPFQRWNNPEFSKWESEIDKTLGMIRTGSLEKIVLSRLTRLQFQKTLNPFAILKNLEKTACNSTLFCLQISQDKSFIGATPELLYRRSSRHIVTEAIAGTRPRGKNTHEDAKFKKELMTNTKELHEFEVVCKYIENRLDAYCENFHRHDESRVIQTSTAQHLYHTYEGKLKQEILDSELIRALHPTPATCGMPAKFAKETIYDIESHDRGWYAAPFGWIGKENTDLFVGIRSALIEQNKLYLFAGTGIVNGSIAKNEWEELEYKISQYLKIF